MEISPQLAAFFDTLAPFEAPVNPYWQFVDEEVNGNRQRYIVPKEGNPLMDSFDIEALRPLIKLLQTFFASVFEKYGTECQVFLLNEHDAAIFDPMCDKIKSPIKGVHIFFPPQEISPANTIVDEEYWHRELTQKGIIPLMRVHSHHMLDAYQSLTDWNSLNANTFEMVLGDVFNDNCAIAYWMDKTGTDAKDVSWTTRLGADTTDMHIRVRPAEA